MLMQDFIGIVLSITIFLYPILAIWAFILYKKNYVGDSEDNYIFGFIVTWGIVIGASIFIFAHYFAKEGMGFERKGGTND